jgi:hypothetical protein
MTSSRRAPPDAEENGTAAHDHSPTDGSAARANSTVAKNNHMTTRYPPIAPPNRRSSPWARSASEAAPARHAHADTPVISRRAATNATNPAGPNISVPARHGPTTHQDIPSRRPSRYAHIPTAMSKHR